jgi:hypothetical protein
LLDTEVLIEDSPPPTPAPPEANYDNGSDVEAVEDTGGDGSDGGSKEGGLLTEALARRIWAKKALWLVYTVYALEREHDFFFEVTRHSPK